MPACSAIRDPRCRCSRVKKIMPSAFYVHASSSSLFRVQDFCKLFPVEADALDTTGFTYDEAGELGFVPEAF